MLCHNPYIRNFNQSKFQATRSIDNMRDSTPFPCGRCLPCRINKAREVVSRILLESYVYNKNTFLTLTYDDAHVPFSPETNKNILVKKDLQNYLKRLRYRLKKKIRYYAVGEYGEQTERPHFHLILFNVHPVDDKVAMQSAWSKRGIQFGFVYTGDVNPSTARYISGYCIKKMNYTTHPDLDDRTPEFSLSSKKDGGIGLPAIKIIAEQIRGDPDHDLQVIRKISFGKKEYFLGRYLTKKLAELLGTSEKLIQKELIEHQMKIFDKHMVLGGGVEYYFNIVEEEEGKRRNLIKKHKLFKQKRIL